MELSIPKVGSFISLLGGILLLRWGLEYSLFIRNFTIDITTTFRYIHLVVTLIWSSLAIVGSVIVLRGDNKGYKFCTISGIGAIVGTFVPIFFYDTGFGYIQFFYLSGTGNFTDIVLILLGAILGYALEEKEIRSVKV
ncbi:MAG: hypothetical protein ACFFD7_02395 [Candidatus Thorarchaeota archaeon]